MFVCLPICVCVGACVILPLTTFTGSLKLFFTLCLKQFSISASLLPIFIVCVHFCVCECVCVCVYVCVRDGGTVRGELFLCTRLHPIHFELASCFSISRRLIYLL